MNGLDICLLLGEVDERFIFEMLDWKENEKKLKERMIKIKRYSICAVAILALAICGSFLMYHLIDGTANSLEGDNENPRSAVNYEQPIWNEMDMNERYSKLVMGDIVYYASDGICDEIIGKHIGIFTLVGYERTKKPDNSMAEKGEKKVERIEVNDDLMVGFKILGDKESVWKTEEHTILVNVYEITGINKNFAVGVEFEETGECFVYYNSMYSAETFQEFAQDSSLEQYLSINKAFQYREDMTCCSSTEIEAGVIFDVLFSNKSAPMFTSDELFTAFQMGIMKDSNGTVKNNGDSTKPYNPQAEDSLDMLFFMDKEYGEKVVSLSVNFDLLGQKNVLISLRSGGFVTTDIGMTGKCFYVGKEVIEEVCGWLNENVGFIEVAN